jgi:hypothetical protein
MRNNLSKLIIAILILGLISLACNFLSLINPDEEAATEEPAEQEAQDQNDINATQTALVAQITSQAQDDLPVEPEDLVETAVPAAEDAADIAHDIIPGNAGASEGEIIDNTSQDTAELGYTLEGDFYVNGLMLERPFNQNMIYRPEIDIQQAQISSDGEFLTVTITLFAVDSATNTLIGEYGVEIDTDLDGVGEFLVWTSVPEGTEWSIDAVRVYQDANQDIGGETKMQSDAPTDQAGDGYETLLFSIDSHIDPDAAWSRINPQNPASIQLSFKRSLIPEESFLWNVWADDAIKNPGLFNYHDRFTLEEAGSPLKDHANYPLKQLHSVDNTCRLGYNQNIVDPHLGTCGTSPEDVAPVVTSAPTIIPTVLPSAFPTLPPVIGP